MERLVSKNTVVEFDGENISGGDRISGNRFLVDFKSNNKQGWQKLAGIWNENFTTYSADKLLRGC